MTTKDFTAHMAEIAEEEARILKQNRLLREEIGHSTAPRRTAAGTRSRAKERSRQGVTREVMRCTPVALDSRRQLWRGYSPLEGSATFACQGGGECARLRRAVGEERCTRVSSSGESAGLVASSFRKRVRCSAFWLAPGGPTACAVRHRMPASRYRRPLPSSPLGTETDLMIEMT